MFLSSSQYAIIVAGTESHNVKHLTLSLTHLHTGVPAQSELHPWQHRSSQCSGWCRSDSKAVGTERSLPQENTEWLNGRSGRHGAKEVAGT